ncbi:MAG TPA: AAA family ATPase [Lacipirellulaceae bacterium]|jgi:flagellar biosynthesis protein FlhG|nr:AAA family ATPase [Lacipirellulaceae bacterium]
MIDQAHKLRSMVQAAAPAVDDRDVELPLVVVAGARAGVGATTVALNLAAVLADQGERVLLVDGGLPRNEANEIVGNRRGVEFGLGDVLNGRCEIREAIVSGPAGVRMLINRGNDRANADFSRIAQERLFNEFESVGDSFDFIVMDTGRGLTSWSRPFWSRAKLVVLVATPDATSVLDAYAAIKQNAVDGDQSPLRMLMNQTESDSAASDAQRSVEQACKQYLGRSVPALPALPRHLANDFVAIDAAPRVWESPNTAFGHAALWLGRSVSELLAIRTRQTISDSRGEFSRIMAGAV